MTTEHWMNGQANLEWKRRLANEQSRLGRGMTDDEIATFYERIRGDALGYGYPIEIEEQT